MTYLRTLLVATAASTLFACAQTPAGGGLQPPASPVAASDMGEAARSDRMAAMDTHMKSMNDMHERMMRARNPQERDALRVEHRKLMHDGMRMLGPTSHDGMGHERGMHGPGATGGSSSRETMEARLHMLEKRIGMMQSMMQMTIDQMPPASIRQ